MKTEVLRRDTKMKGSVSQFRPLSMLDGRQSSKQVGRKNSQNEILHSRSILDEQRCERREQERMRTLDNLLVNRVRCR